MESGRKMRYARSKASPHDGAIATGSSERGTEIFVGRLCVTLEYLTEPRRRDMPSIVCVGVYHSATSCMAFAMVTELETLLTYRRGSPKRPLASLPSASVAAVHFTTI